MKTFVLHPITLSILGVLTLPVGIIAVLALFAVCTIADCYDWFLPEPEQSHG